MNETVEIPLTRGYVAIIDSEDEALVSQYNWQGAVDKKTGTIYAIRSTHPGTVRLHRLLIGAKPGECVDHINGDGLDNRKCNLRLATKSQNAANQSPRNNNTSGYKGVHLRKDKGMYVAYISARRQRRLHLGYFPTAIEAARAYDAKAIELHGEFARLNFPISPVDLPLAA